jgi:hypothetical protein
MITQEHLEHWINEIRYQLNGIRNEIAKDKVKMIGINVGKNGEAFVSFEYLQEKVNSIEGNIGCIESDVRDDQ